MNNEVSSFDLGETKTGWSFHFDLNRNPSGWGTNYYSLGWVLAANENDFSSNTVDGYAVLWTVTDDELVLVSFENGISGNDPGTKVIGTGLDWDNTSGDGVNVRVEVTQDGTWTIYWEEGSPIATPTDIDANSATSTGNVTTYFTDTNMKYSGPIWAHSTATSGTSNGDFDNFVFGIAADTVTISKTVVPITNVANHDAVTYTVVISNGATISETGALLTDTLPISATFGSWIISPTNTVLNDDVITWMGTLTNNTAITLSFTAIHTGTYEDVVSNTAEYSGSVVISATDTFTVASATPELIINKTGPDYAVIGDMVVYEVTVQNDGDAAATNVVLTDTLPLSTTYVSDDSGWTCSACIPGATGTITWDVGDVSSNTLHAFNLTARVDISVTGGTVLTNEVETSTDAAGDDLLDNTDYWETTVVSDPVGGATYPNALTYLVVLVALAALGCSILAGSAVAIGKREG